MVLIAVGPSHNRHCGWVRAASHGGTVAALSRSTMVMTFQMEWGDQPGQSPGREKLGKTGRCYHLALYIYKLSDNHRAKTPKITRNLLPLRELRTWKDPLPAARTAMAGEASASLTSYTASR